MPIKIKTYLALFLLVLVVAAGSGSYVVKRGDNLSKIAEEQHTTVAALVEANGIENPNHIYVGQELIIPSSSGTYVVQPGDSLERIAAKFGTTVKAISDANGITNPNRIYVGTSLRISGEAPAPFQPETGSASTYTVKRGDTLSKIAARFGTTVTAIADANGISNPNRIYIGQVLTVTDGGWLCPVPGASFFNDWGFPRSGGRTHEGNDLFAPRGTPVLAPVSGIVRQVVGSIGGNQFVLEGDDGVRYIGSHLDRFGADGRVHAGEVIGYVGDSGNAYGSRTHLHFEVHPDDGPAVNPYPALAKACG